jgi:HAD superfamily hydrolase (TIGR01509 family)
MSRSDEIRAVLFDLDGVIVDSYETWFRQFRQALLHFGHPPISEHEFRRHWGQSTEHDVRLFMPGTTVEEVKQYFFDHYSNYVQYLIMEEDAGNSLDLVTELHLRVGCVTNSHRPIVEQTLSHLRLSRCFEAIVTADDVKEPKPASEMIFQACQDLAVLPENTVFLGDTLTDAEAAYGAGCIFVGYRIASKVSVDSHQEFAIYLKHMLGITASE